MNVRDRIIDDLAFKYLSPAPDEYQLFEPTLKEKVHRALTSREENRVWAAAKLVLIADDFKFSRALLDEIVEKCTDLPKSKWKTLSPDYRDYVKIAVMLLEQFNAGARCHCGIYQKWQLSDPQAEAKFGFLNQIGKVETDPNTFNYITILECPTCNTNWRVSENTSYHYSVYDWSKIAD